MPRVKSMPGYAFRNAPQPYGEIFIIKIDGTGLRQLTDDKWEDGPPSWIR